MKKNTLKIQKKKWDTWDAKKPKTWKEAWHSDEQKKWKAYSTILKESLKASEKEAFKKWKTEKEIIEGRI